MGLGKFEIGTSDQIQIASDFTTERFYEQES